MIAIVTFLLLCGYIMIFVVVKPFQAALSGIDESIVISEERLEKGRQILEKRGNLQGALDSLVKEWGFAASDAAENSEIINALEAAATTANIRILNIEPRPIIRDTLARYPIALTISGTSKNMVQFLFIIQAKPLALNVENLNLERAIDGNATINGSLVVTRLRIIR